MNKKLQNGLVVAVSAAMGTGIVAPVIAAAATTGTSLDAQYKAAYDATVKATASKDQKDLTAARVLVDGLYQAVKGTKLEYLGTTLSSLLDPAQQVKLNDLYTAMAKADASLKQADINAARDLLLAMPQQWVTTFSSANDAIQQKLDTKVSDAVVKAETSNLEADKAAALALIADVKTATNNAGVTTWAAAMETRANAVVTAAKVSSVSAINSTTLEVAFSAPVDTTKAVFTVVKTDADGNKVTVPMTATFNADMTKADLTTGGKLLKGSYAVTVSGISLGTNSATASVSAEAVAKIQILGTKMIGVTGSPTLATVQYVAYNQYGEDVTKSSVASSITWTSSLGSSLATASSKTVTLNKGANFASTDTAVLTAIDSSTGVTATQTLTYASSLSVVDVAFGTPVLPTGKTAIEVNQSPAVSIPLTVKDEFGNTVTNLTTLNNAITKIVSTGRNTDASFALDGNSKPILNLDTTQITDNATVVITLIVNATGKSFTTSVNVVKAAAPASVAFGGYDGVVAAGDTSLTLPITVSDQFGNVLSADDLVSDGGVTVTSSNPAVIPGMTIAQSGSHKGKLVLTGPIGTTKGTSVITATVGATGKSASMTISTVDARYPSALVLPSAFKTNLINGSTYQFAADYNDQYGSEITASDYGYGDTTKYSVKSTLTNLTGDASALSLSNNGVAVAPSVAQGSNYYTLTSVAGKTGSFKLATVVTDTVNNVVISEIDKTIQVVANNQSGLTYSIKDIPTLDGNTANITPIVDPTAPTGAEVTAAVGNPQSRKISISAVDASGANYAVPASQLFNVTTSDNTVARVVKSGSNWYVVAADVTGKSLTANQTATITGYVNTDNGVQQFTKTVTVSPLVAVAQKVKLVDTAKSDNYTMDSSASDITDLSYANRAGAETGTNMYAYWLDQYGVYHQFANTAFTPSDSTKVLSQSGAYGTSNGFVFDGTSSFKLVDTATPTDVAYRANTPLYLTLFKDGVSATVRVSINSEEAPAAYVVAGNALATGVANAGFTLTDNATVTNDTIAVAAGTIQAGDTAVIKIAGVTYSLTNAATTTVGAYTSNQTATITITDAAGNKTAQTITLTCAN